ncbi:MAG: hypothetical protein ACOC5J_03160 [Gemmatimonadota bacterium]
MYRRLRKAGVDFAFPTRTVHVEHSGDRRVRSPMILVERPEIEVEHANA